MLQLMLACQAVASAKAGPLALNRNRKMIAKITAVAITMPKSQMVSAEEIQVPDILG
jgi:hypothetical protein